MPKIVDHDDRRRELAEAAWRVVLSNGIDGATTREIARESGYSAGVLSHYFESKDDILQAALELSHATILRRFDEILAQHEGMEALWVYLLDNLPLGPRQVDETNLEISFWSRALVNDDLRAIQRAESRQFRVILRTLVGQAQDREELDPAADPEEITALLAAVIDGLSVHALLYPDRFGKDRLIRLMEAELDRWRGPAATGRRSTTRSKRRRTGA